MSKFKVGDRVKATVADFKSEVVDPILEEEKE